MIQSIVFDAVGTLIFPAEPIELTYQKAFARFGVHAEAMEIKSSFRTSFRTSFDAKQTETLTKIWSPEALEQIGALKTTQKQSLLLAYPTCELDQRQKWSKVVRLCVESIVQKDALELSSQVFDYLWDYFANASAWVVEPTFQSVAQRLKQQKIKWCIGSNFDSRLERVIEGHNLFRDCFAIFDSARVGYEKPDPRFYLAIENAMNLTKQECHMIGDDELRDCIAPRLFGWNATLYDGNECLQKLVDSVFDLDDN